MKQQYIFSTDEINRILQFQIDDFPELHQAATNESIIIFIGAGVSKLYGCLLWHEMAVKLAEDLRETKVISYAEQDILLKEAITDPRKVISICYRKCKTNDSLDIYERTIMDSVEIKDKIRCQEIYKKIFSIGAMAHLTTNIDIGIKEYISSIQVIGRHIKYFDCTSHSDQERIKLVNYNIFKDGNVIYLHGSYKNIHEAVLPIEKYLSYYSESNLFLNELFETINRMKSLIIFLGYGLNEWDVIERIYKLKTFRGERIAYLLSPIYTHEITKFKLEMDYYKSFGVEPIPFIIDDEGYEKIFFVLDNLSRAIDKSTPSPYEIISEIEEG